MTRRRSVRLWFALIVGGLLAVAAVGVFAGVFALDRLTERRVALVDGLEPAEAAVRRLATAVLDEDVGVRSYAAARDRAFLEPYERGRREREAALGELDALLRRNDLAGVRADLARVRELVEAWHAGFAEPTIAAVAAGDEGPAASIGRARFAPVRAAMMRLRRDVTAARAEARRELDDAATFVDRIFIAVGLVIILAVVIAGLMLNRIIIAPLGRLAGDVRAVADGDFGHSVSPSGPREIARLGDDVEAMRRKIVAEVAALRDAERTLIEQALNLQRSNEELEQFAYVASHDLQEPLRKVASFTQMLERRYKGELDERADRYIAFAVDGAKRMQDLINDLLAFSRVGRMTAPHERVPAGDLIEAAKARLASALEENGAEVTADGMPVVTGDAGLLTGVFQNLIGNAIKFRGDKPPRVHIEAERDGRYWRFTCTDNGIGVDDEYAERIFVIFQRLHTRDAYEGTGIGLAMCRKIIEYHGGHIWLAPSEAGRGARFVFTLPADDPEEEPAA